MAAEISRRTLLEVIGRLGGAATAYSALNMAGLLATPTAYAAPPVLTPASGNGRRVAILGAGIAGLTAAHCLGKAGYQCTILEARARSGGHCWPKACFFADRAPCWVSRQRLQCFLCWPGMLNDFPYAPTI